MKYYIIAGEASGDLHGSNLMKGLFAEDNDAVIRFRGGEMMQKVLQKMSRKDLDLAGMAYDYKEGAVMGFVEVLAKAGKLLQNLDDCKQDIVAFDPDVIILIDYPGFNLKIAKWAHKLGYKVFYYIAPKVWASREGRIAKLKKYVDHLFIIFPFEKEYFAKHGLPYTYCGNPLVDAVDSSPASTQSREEFLQEMGIHPSKHVVALLAGSRLNEVKTMMPLFNEAARMLHDKPQFKDYIFVVAGAPGREIDDYGYFERSYMRVIFGRTWQILRSADAAAINSGTASLEAALLGTPQVVVYKIGSQISYAIGKLIMRAPFISLGNLCLGRMAFKEFYHNDDCNAENLAAELEKLLLDESYRRHMMEDYQQIRNSLGGRGASRDIAHAMVEMLKN